MREFQRFAQLVNRPIISKTLISEREALLGLLGAQLRRFKEESAVSCGRFLLAKAPKTLNFILSIFYSAKYRTGSSTYLRAKIPQSRSMQLYGCVK